MPDVTVLGGGIFGLSVAWACLLGGASVRVLERRSIGAGASGGIVGALAPHTPENWNDKKQFQFESLIAAERWWAEIDAASGRSSGYARTGRLQPVLDERGLALAQDRAHQAKTLWQGSAHWTIREARGDWCPVSPTGWVVEDTLSARIHPRKAVQSLAQAIRNRGGEILEGSDAYETEGVVVEATGYEGLLAMSDRLTQPVGNGVKGQAILVKYDAVDRSQLFADALHIVPHADGTVAIGSTSERDWEHSDQTDTQLDDVFERALAAFPVLQDAPVLARWAGVRPRAKSRAPMLGSDPHRDGVFIANGGFKIGFGMAPKAGQVMADLILNGVDRIPESFRVEASLR